MLTNFWLLLCFIGIGNTQIYPDATLTVEEMVRKSGYPFEAFSNLVTEDGYILNTFRIPYGKTNTNTTRPVVLLVHGLTGSSRNFIAMGPERGLAFVLADQGYDVWLANCRGTTPSKKHLTLDPRQSKFWEFSWHEMGVYDLPAIFEQIKNVTKYEQISYIGYSQGSTVFFALGSERPEYNRNVTIAIMLGPEAYIKFDTPVFKVLAVFEPIYRVIIDSTGLHQFPPRPLDILGNVLLNLICTLEGFFQQLCASILFIFGGYDPDQLNKEDLPKLVAGYPVMVAARQILHYAQLANTRNTFMYFSFKEKPLQTFCTFGQYDYGPAKNKQKYGCVRAPLYNLSKISAPVALYYGKADWLVDQKDIERLCEELPKCVHKYLVEYETFNHFDFVLAKDLVKFAFKDIFKTLKEYNRNCKAIKAC